MDVVANDVDVDVDALQAAASALSPEAIAFPCEPTCLEYEPGLNFNGDDDLR